MTSAAYYRDEAIRFRELAKKAGSEEMRRLLKRAAEYEQLAESVDFLPGKPQPQPVQQQQTKSTDED